MIRQIERTICRTESLVPNNRKYQDLTKSLAWKSKNLWWNLQSSKLTRKARRTNIMTRKPFCWQKSRRTMRKSKNLKGTSWISSGKSRGKWRNFRKSTIKSGKAMTLPDIDRFTIRNTISRTSCRASTNRQIDWTNSKAAKDPRRARIINHSSFKSTYPRRLDSVLKNPLYF